MSDFDSYGVPDEKQLLRRIKEYKTRMENVVANADDADDFNPDAMLGELKEFITGDLRGHSDFHARFLTMMQNKCSAMIQAFLKQKEHHALDTAARIYMGWHEIYEEENYANEDRMSMINDHIVPLLKTAVAWDDKILASALLDTTLMAQANILACTQAEIDFIYSAQEQFLGVTSEDVYALENRASEEKKKIASFIIRYAPCIILQTPNATEDGLDHKRVGAMEDLEFSRKEYAYSYGDEATDLYEKAAKILADTAPLEMFVAFAHRLMPELPKILLSKHISYQAISFKDGSVVGGDTLQDTDSALDVMRDTYKLLRDRAPEATMMFVAQTYEDIADTLVERKEPEALCQFYDDTCEALKKTQQDEDNVALFRNVYVSRTIYRMMHQGKEDQAEIFLRHIRQTSALPSSKALMLLDEQAASVVCVSAPVNNGKTNATILFAKENSADAPHVLFHQNRKNTSERSDKPRKMTEKRLLQQVGDLLKDIMAPSSIREHIPHAPRWCSVECRRG